MVDPFLPSSPKEKSFSNLQVHISEWMEEDLDNHMGIGLAIIAILSLYLWSPLYKDRARFRDLSRKETERLGGIMMDEWERAQLDK